MKGGLQLNVDSLRVKRGEGLFGLLAAEASDWVNSDFMEDVLTYSELSLNYNQLNLPNDSTAHLSAESYSLRLDGSGFRILLNIDEVLSADP